MKKYKWLIILLNLILLLVYFNWSVFKKEELLKDGELVLLKLAPVDPRSLMQGDYMTLRYDISQNIDAEKIPKRGYCIVKLDSQGIAKKVRFQQDKTPLRSGEHLIQYNAPDNWNVNIGAESYFFEEGQAEKYAKAEYGGIKIDQYGNSILIGLYNKNLKLIK
ncbi:GDYXXLXY domain-containing protein [Chryseobacterium sp. PBS4-4]|uniref:GDYXXLXY domain-containing protein n=1 Tax=Chryseobacterium edaphi TaxID=2976532 RepID=A0ABT2W7Q3_9FLAO|nr:GDYXXLXY domain-containing protein [Chryseobacterium edaphi]MCU7617993.1 GDYXXLXY domain-containing protein [Chryseobacterium edaphi]